MAELGERVARIEGTVEEQTMRIDDVRDTIKGLDERMDRRFDGVDRRFDAVDHRFDAVGRRFENVDRRFDSLERKLDSHFKWLVGVVVAAFGTVASLILRH